jgi:hypothetical protein
VFSNKTVSLDVSTIDDSEEFRVTFVTSNVAAEEITIFVKNISDSESVKETIPLINSEFSQFLL